MRYRELKLRPLAGKQEGEARVHRVQGDGTFVAVLHGNVRESTIDRVADGLRKGGFKGTLIHAAPGAEFTLCEVEDGAPARWQEDGRPSYQDLEKRVKELEGQLAMGSGADCAPFTVRP